MELLPADLARHVLLCPGDAPPISAVGVALALLMAAAAGGVDAAVRGVVQGHDHHHGRIPDHVGRRSL